MSEKISSLSSHLLIIGWREWLDLPDLGIQAIKAKIDTGARSSALHAFDIHSFTHHGREMLHFQIHPYQKNSDYTIRAIAPLLEWRTVRNSGGHSQHRPVILTSVHLSNKKWLIELTLTNRDVMGFRMLLGRQAIRGNFLVNPNQSFLLSQAPLT